MESGKPEIDHSELHYGLLYLQPSRYSSGKGLIYAWIYLYSAVLIVRRIGFHVVEIDVIFRRFVATCGIIYERLHLLGLQLKEVRLREQRYLVKISIQNPNDFDLDIRGVDFKVELNDEHFAQGLSNEAVSLPGFGEAATRILVSSSILILARQLSNGQQNGKGVKYRLTGHVELAGVPMPVSFENEGDLASLIK